MARPQLVLQLHQFRYLRVAALPWHQVDGEPQTFQSATITGDVEHRASPLLVDSSRQNRFLWPSEECVLARSWTDILPLEVISNSKSGSLGYALHLVKADWARRYRIYCPAKDSAGIFTLVSPHHSHVLHMVLHFPTPCSHTLFHGNESFCALCNVLLLCI